MRYPSAAAFDEMWHSDAYRRVAHLCTDAVQRAVLTRFAIDPESGVAVLNMLWFHNGGRQRYDEYRAAGQPRVENVGGRYVAPRFLPEQAYDDVVNHPDYEQVSALRTAAVRRSATTILRVHRAESRLP